MIADPGRVSTLGVRTTEGRDDVVVNMLDACDPDTFNQALQNQNPDPSEPLRMSLHPGIFETRRD